MDRVWDIYAILAIFKSNQKKLPRYIYSIFSEAYRRLFNFGAETLQRDYDLERAFN